jgi:trehalose-phosphatase
VPIMKIPEDAVPNDDLLAILKQLSSKGEVNIVSGRKIDDLGRWFGNLSLNLAAEHGAFVFKNLDDGKRGWKPLVPIDDERDKEWKRLIMEIFEYYTERTPGSFIERKMSSITWHYRLAEVEFGQWQAKECMNHIEENIISDYPIQLLCGKKNIEVRLCSSNKGEFVKDTLASGNYDFIFCAGDDSTDEDMFKALADYKKENCSIFTCLIGIGARPTSAHFSISSPSQLSSFLKKLI